jgi:hypothetical protein
MWGDYWRGLFGLVSMVERKQSKTKSEEKNTQKINNKK